MAEQTTFLQLPIISQFILPFMLIWFIVFALLEKTKLLGEKKQINSIVALVIGLIFVGAVFPKLIVSNLILFLTVAIVCVFVALLIWGFIFGTMGDKVPALDKWLKLGLAVVVTVAFVWAIVWATGFSENVGTFFSGNGLGQTILVNGVFVLVIAAALALILRNQK